MNDEHVIEIFTAAYAYFAELVLDDESQEAFREASNSTCQELGLDLRFDIDDGELLPRE